MNLSFFVNKNNVLPYLNKSIAVNAKTIQTKAWNTFWYEYVTKDLSQKTSNNQLEINFNDVVPYIINGIEYHFPVYTYVTSFDTKTFSSNEEIDLTDYLKANTQLPQEIKTLVSLHIELSKSIKTLYQELNQGRKITYTHIRDIEPMLIDLQQLDEKKMSLYLTTKEWVLKTFGPKFMQLEVTPVPPLPYPLFDYQFPIEEKQDSRGTSIHFPPNQTNSLSENELVKLDILIQNINDLMKNTPRPKIHIELSSYGKWKSIDLNQRTWRVKDYLQRKIPSDIKIILLTDKEHQKENEREYVEVTVFVSQNKE